MDRHDEEIDRVLRMLGTAEAGSGLEGRVLAGLQGRDRGMSASEALAPRFQWWYAAVILTAACVLLFGVRSAVRVNDVLPAVQVTVGSAKASRTGAPVLLTPKQRVTQTFKPKLPLQVRATPLASPVASRGLADLPSQCALPESPTTQERLLVEIAHGPGPPEFALLNPEKRELLAQQQEIEFATFFPPPIPEEIYLAKHKEN